MDIIMIRHGESEDNVSRVFGTFESPLSENGIEQIKVTKENLREFDFTRVYYSPFARTVETLKYLDLEGRPDSRIGEYNFGIFSGKTNSIIEEEFPLEYSEWIDNPKDYIIREGESLTMVYNRVKEFLEEMVKQDEDLVLVTHAGVIRLALCWVFDDIDYFFKFKVDNGSINTISIDEEGFKFIKKLNYSPRLK